MWCFREDLVIGALIGYAATIYVVYKYSNVFDELKNRNHGDARIDAVLGVKGEDDNCFDLAYASMVAHELRLPLIWDRRKPKEHGLGKRFEGKDPSNYETIIQIKKWEE